MHLWCGIVQNSSVCRGGFRGGGGGGGGRSGPPLSYMKNDIMHTIIYAAFCKSVDRNVTILAYASFSATATFYKFIPYLNQTELICKMVVNKCL